MNTVFLHNWSKVTSNAWVLQSVKGYWLELIKELQQWKHLGMSQKDLRLVMAKLLQAAKEVEQVVKEVETVAVCQADISGSEEGWLTEASG